MGWKRHTREVEKYFIKIDKLGVLEVKEKLLFVEILISYYMFKHHSPRREKLKRNEMEKRKCGRSRKS